MRLSPVIAAVMLVAIAIPGSSLAADQDPVTSGRKALDPPHGYPWYDPKADDLRPLDVSPKAEANESGDSGRGGKSGGKYGREGRGGRWKLRSRSDSGKGSSPSERESRPMEIGHTAFGSVLQVLAWTIIGIVLGAVIYLLVRAFILRRREKDEEGAEAKGDSAKLDALPMKIPARSDLLTEARRQYELGNYRQAIIYLFSFQLVQLDKQQIIRLAKGKTNRQYLREVGPRQTLRWIVEQTMVAFEDVFFGHHSLDRGRFEACWSKVGEFERLAAEGGSAG